MIGDYCVVALVFGIVVSFIACIHHFWLREAARDAAQPHASSKARDTAGIANPQSATTQPASGLSPRGYPSGFAHGLKETRL